MGILDMFKKKKEPEEDMFKEDDIFKEESIIQGPKMPEMKGIEKGFDTGLPEEGMPPAPKMTFGEEKEAVEPEVKPRLQPTTLEPVPAAVGGRDIELILSKLDTIKASLESINVRLEVLERMAKENKKLW